MAASDNAEEILDDLTYMPEEDCARYVEKMTKGEMQAVLHRAVREIVRMRGDEVEGDRCLQHEDEEPVVNQSLQGELVRVCNDLDDVKTRLQLAFDLPADNRNTKRLGQHSKGQNARVKGSGDVNDEEDDNEDDATAEVTSYIPGVDLPIALKVPRGDKTFTIYEYDHDLAGETGHELAHRFKRMCTEPKYRARTYRQTVQNPDCRMDLPHCFRGLLTRSSRDGSSKNNKNHKREADTKCINHNVPCGYLCMYKGKATMMLVPLPQELRRGKVWTDLKFWIHSP